VTQNSPTASVVIVAYRPKPGKQDELMQLTREHVEYLRSEGLATDREAVVMEAADGSIVEVFEWAPGGVEKAHHPPGVAKLWERYWAACDIVPLKDLAECGGMFAGFRPLDL
jgi:hypothetical protein